MLVPGDIVSIKLGDIIPADARLLEGDPLKIDQVQSHLYVARVKRRNYSGVLHFPQKNVIINND